MRSSFNCNDLSVRPLNNDAAENNDMMINNISQIKKSDSFSGTRNDFVKDQD